MSTILFTLSILSGFERLNQHCCDELAQIVEIKKMQKRDLLLAPGERKLKTHLVISGALRGFFKVGRREITNQLLKPGQLIAYDSNLKNDWSHNENFHALGNAAVAAFPAAKLNALCDKYADLGAVFAKLYQQLVMNAEFDNRMLHLGNDERFHYFKRHYNSFNRYLTVEHCASFLALSRVTYLRTKKRTESG
jgi:CRP-like cAMP-binding protein